MLEVKIFQTGMLKQVMGLVSTHAISVMIITIFGFGFMSWMLEKPTLYAICCIIMTLIYFSAIYSKAWDAAARDKKPYTETSVYIFKGAVLAAGILILNLLLWLGYIFAWTFLIIDGYLSSATAIIYNILYVINTFMYSGFVTISEGHTAWYGYLFIYLVPLIASTIGYIAGVHDFTLSDKLMPFIYDNSKKKQ